MQGSYSAGWPFPSRAWLLLNQVGGVESSEDISPVLLCSASYIPSTFLQQTLSVCHTRHLQALQAQHGREQQKPLPSWGSSSGWRGRAVANNADKVWGWAGERFGHSLTMAKVREWPVSQLQAGEGPQGQGRYQACSGGRPGSLPTSLWEGARAEQDVPGD